MNAASTENHGSSSALATSAPPGLDTHAENLIKQMALQEEYIQVRNLMSFCALLYVIDDRV
jgi:hypothetical protein